jgi:long-chain acyl-CoA synthetase
MFGVRVLPALVLTAALLTAPLAHSAEVAGVKLEDRAKVGGTELLLNGAGLRTRLFFKVYVAALYAPKKSPSTAAILESREPRRFNLHLLRELDADSLVGALKDGLRHNHSDSELAALKTDIDQFESLMRAIGTGKPGDVITLDFTGEGTAVGFNGQAKGSVAGDAFGRALLKVWLGEKPVDTALKQALLGG